MRIDELDRAFPRLRGDRPAYRAQRAFAGQIRADSGGRLDPGGDARGAFDHHGARRAGHVPLQGDRGPAAIAGGNRRGGHPLFGQDRHPDQEPAHAGRAQAVSGQRCGRMHSGRGAGRQTRQHRRHRSDRAPGADRSGGARPLSPGEVHPLRSGRQAHRKHRNRAGRPDAAVHQRRAASDRRALRP
ncbi:hypothetical protein SDC9_175503 [bioreactor metagenome]|uniref:Uncharacterized protein n=1 Tax=bioreactor metagenome TaxID=1076179 RepID=A0A645GVK7_9ZZZZ